NVFFIGDAPGGVSPTTFSGDNGATVYYLPGSAGWTTTFAGRPALLWNPQIQTGAGIFGVQSNQFRFTITGTTNIPMVVEASANLTNGPWLALQRITLSNGSVSFSDPQWTNYSTRFYRLRAP